MKLQIEGQKLRIRIDEDELAQLLHGERVEMRTEFADAFAIGFAVRVTQDDSATVLGKVNSWLIGIPELALREHAARLPTREGLRYTLQGNGAESSLELLFDVDVRDSVKHRRQR